MLYSYKTLFAIGTFVLNKTLFESLLKKEFLISPNRNFRKSGIGLIFISEELVLCLISILEVLNQYFGLAHKYDSISLAILDFISFKMLSEDAT